MAKKTFKRIHRVGKLSPQEAARDREIRRKIMEEFPPLEREQADIGYFYYMRPRPHFFPFLMPPA
jgi:hypothetical protein